MACEDYPCCGHESGDCPRIDSKGRNRWTCVECGKTLPLKAQSSICLPCQKKATRRMRNGEDMFDDYDDYDR